MSAEDAAAERKKGNYVVEEPGKGFRRVVSAPNPVKIVELDAIRTLSMRIRLSSPVEAEEFRSLSRITVSRRQRCH